MSDKLKTISVTGAFSHFSHGLGEHVSGHAVKGNLARDGAPKKISAISVNSGMAKVSKSGAVTLGGDHASALDSLSGLEVIPDKSGAVAAAHPLTAPPIAKNYKPAQPVVGQRSRTNEGIETHADKVQHGDDMLASAVRN